MTQPLIPPPIKPFERLQVQDGLLMNAERWQKAHDYHRQRQNVHYQSLNQPGIVCDIGVRLIPPPTDVDAKYRDSRWVQIQPGIAIDLYGNIIVVPQAIDFRITSENLTPDPLTVYLVVSYVDPSKLRRKEYSELVTETFRIDEKKNPPGDLEVELCRIVLEPGAGNIKDYALKLPVDVFFPGYYELDLRYRVQARSRPLSLVRIAQLTIEEESHSPISENLQDFLESIVSLYPPLEGDRDVASLSLQQPRTQPTFEPTPVVNYDLLYLQLDKSLQLEDREFERLKAYLDKGTVLFVEVPTANRDIINSVQAIAQTLGSPLEDWQNLNRQHPLRRKPFLFSALPSLNRQTINLLCGGGIILVSGNLSQAWGLDDRFALPRETIRTAQEFGINILHYAWRRRQIIQLSQAEITPPTPQQQTTPRSRVKSVLDRLAE